MNTNEIKTMEERFENEFNKWIFHNEHGLCVFPDKITAFIKSEIDLALEKRNKEVERVLNTFEVYYDEPDNCRRLIGELQATLTSPKTPDIAD